MNVALSRGGRGYRLRMADSNSTSRNVTAVERCFVLLDSFRQGEPSVALTELAKRSGLAPSTTHRLLATLVDCGYVVALGNGQYRLGLKAWQLGCRAISQLDIPTAIQPQLERLAAASGETVHVSVLHGPSVVYVARIASSHRVAAQTYLGQSAPAVLTATGRALLAFSPPAAVDRVLDEALRDGTVASRGKILALLEEVRDTGIARTFEEWQSGLAGVAAPLRDQSGHAIAAMGVAGPSSRFTPEAMEDAAALVRDAAAGVSEQFGYLPDGAWAPPVGQALADAQGRPR